MIPRNKVRRFVGVHGPERQWQQQQLTSGNTRLESGAKMGVDIERLSCVHWAEKGPGGRDHRGSSLLFGAVPRPCVVGRGRGGVLSACDGGALS
uniref:Uncharacterized protein n=1 Tax=Knipowitschia caucasica TaxID=637954 RepID=A0AAV2MSA9_KNICA